MDMRDEEPEYLSTCEDGTQGHQYPPAPAPSWTRRGSITAMTPGGDTSHQPPHVGEEGGGSIFLLESTPPARRTRKTIQASSPPEGGQTWVAPSGHGYEATGVWRRRYRNCVVRLPSTLPDGKSQIDGDASGDAGWQRILLTPEGADHGGPLISCSCSASGVAPYYTVSAPASAPLSSYTSSRPMLPHLQEQILVEGRKDEEDIPIIRPRNVFMNSYAPSLFSPTRLLPSPLPSNSDFSASLIRAASPRDAFHGRGRPALLTLHTPPSLVPGPYPTSSSSPSEMTSSVDMAPAYGESPSSAAAR
ncbi:hypothetical protein R3P38DRAFT_3469203 [Favolaschia claudopus]|uniref:Uncharacterized protein n=1 Tax=Favolaschia claudopus TaxID=2862362 RepID=A0AAW0CLK4_9AGAR